MSQTTDIVLTAGQNVATVSDVTLVANAFYEVTGASSDGHLIQALLNTGVGGGVASIEMTAGGGCFQLISSNGSLAIDNFDQEARTVNLLVCNLESVGDSSGVENTSLPMRINEPLFAAAFASAIRTQPGVAISLLPYLINPVGTGVLIASNFQNILATQVIIDQSSRSITINKSLDEGDYSFDLSVAQ